MWVCVSELSTSLCVLLCAFSFPPFTPSISLWILSMYFWNNEHRALLFVFPHQNRARVTEGSSDLVISGFYWVMQPMWIPAGACGWAALAVGWDGSPSTSQGNGLSWFPCWQNCAVLAFLFPAFFLFRFFSPPWGAENCLCLGVDTPGMLVVVEECRDSLTHHQGSLFPGFSLCCPPSSHCLYDHSPLTAASSSSVSIFSQLLSLPKDLSETEGGFNLLENSDFAASCSCVSNNDWVGSGFRTWPLFYFAASKSHPLILNHFTDSLEQIDPAFQEKPNHSQPFSLAWGLADQWRGGSVWSICKLSWWSVSSNPFKLGITEQGWISCMIHIQEVMETPRYSWLSVRKG